MLDSPEVFRPHPLHRLWRWLPAQARRRALSNATALIAPRPDRTPAPPAYGLAVGGELSRASGIGERARLMRLGARQLGLPTWSLDVGPPVREHPADLTMPRSEKPPVGAPLVLPINAPLLPLAMLRLGRDVLRHRRIIGYWAWELPIVPPERRVGLKFVHEAWVPSTFTAAALNALLPDRVRVVPHPLSIIPLTVEPDRHGFGLPPDVVTVLVSFNLASSFERKHPLAAVTTFRAAFGDRNDWLLLTKGGYPGHFLADLARLRDAIGGSRNIRLDTGTISPHRSRSLTASADIVLSLHRSEGFGLVPAEAMLLGKPVIATGWSGNRDFMGVTCAVPIGYRLSPVHDSRGVYDIPRAVWAEADHDEAVEQLRRLADDPSLRAELGVRARAAALTRLTAAPLADALRGIGLPMP